MVRLIHCERTEVIIHHAIQTAPEPKPLLKLFELDGKDLVFDGNGLYLFEVDPQTAKILTADEGDPLYTNDETGPEFPEAMERARRLRAASVQAFQPMTGERSLQIASLWLNISHQCNLRCVYCFADGGSYGQGETLMGEAVMEEAVSLFFDQCHSHRARIVFFGGEPLMNVPLLKKAVPFIKIKAEGKGIKLRFSVITNGTILSQELIELFKTNDIKVQISMDGQPAIHDQLRVFSDGSGTSQLIQQNVDQLHEAGLSAIALRSTITHNNCHVGELYDYFKAKGYDRISLVPVQAGDNYPWALTKDDLASIEVSYREKARQIIESLRQGKSTDLVFFSRFVQTMESHTKRHYYCGAGFAYINFTPEGDIYPCHRMIGQRDLRLGDVRTPDFSENAFTALSGTAVDQREVCRDCWAKYFCGGGCYAVTLESQDRQTPDETLCAVTRAVAENSLKIYFTLHSKGG